MFCSNCGKEISNKDKYCPYCGCEISQNEKDGSESSDLQQKEVMQTPEQEKRVDKTVGVLSLVFAFVFPLVGLIISICGLVKYKDKENKSLCMAGLIISGIDIIVYFVISIFLMLAIVAQANYHPNYLFLI
ncbi:MAG: zinc-ribbon domain-containing protein [Bacilli bacterium]|nr:zinc-ribbon domain-containing protein [Bacilli bacterium]